MLTNAVPIQITRFCAERGEVPTKNLRCVAVMKQRPNDDLKRLYFYDEQAEEGGMERRTKEGLSSGEDLSHCHYGVGQDSMRKGSNRW